jgi:hypothetical protein
MRQSRRSQASEWQNEGHASTRVPFPIYWGPHGSRGVRLFPIAVPINRTADGTDKVQVMARRPSQRVAISSSGAPRIAASLQCDHVEPTFWP